MSFSKYTADHQIDFQDHGHVHFYDMDEDNQVCIARFEPGWSWKDDVATLPQFENQTSCQRTHNGYCLEGELNITMDDGTKITVSQGDVFHILPGHHANAQVLTRIVEFHPRINF